MITSFLINVFQGIFFALFGWVNLPQLGIEIISGFNFIITIITNSVSVVGYILSPPLYFATVTILVALWLFEPVFYAARNVAKMIPILGNYLKK